MQYLEYIIFMQRSTKLLLHEYILSFNTKGL